MSLVATEPTYPPENPITDRATVRNDGWFPDIDLTHLRETMRLDGTVTQRRLVDAVVDAVSGVNAQLGTWQAEQVAAGVGGLADVPARRVGGESVKVARYRGAVYRLVKADLTERYRGFDATKSGHALADQFETSIDDDRRAVHWAISDIVGRPRSTVELI